jgi:hypothetical protein
MRSTNIQMPTHSSVLRSEILWRISSQLKQTITRIFTLTFNHLVNCNSTERKISSTFNSNIIHLPFDRHLQKYFSVKPAASIYCPMLLHVSARKWQIQWLKYEQAYCAASWKLKFMCLFAITVHNFPLKHFLFKTNTHIII